MKMKIFSIRDSKAEVYKAPFFQSTHGEAERAFRELISDPKSIVNKYPDDFDLYYLGDYDDQTGVITPLKTPQHVQKAAHLLSAMKQQAPASTASASV